MNFPSIQERNVGPIQNKKLLLIRGHVSPGYFGESHLVVWVKLAAVHVVVVTPQHSDQFSCVQRVHCHRAAAWHKHKLWAAAVRHGELQPFTALIADLPIIHLRETRKETGCVGWLKYYTPIMKLNNSPC